jgi:hypothetical protein
MPYEKFNETDVDAGEAGVAGAVFVLFMIVAGAAIWWFLA